MFIYLHYLQQKWVQYFLGWFYILSHKDQQLYLEFLRQLVIPTVIQVCEGFAGLSICFLFQENDQSNSESWVVLSV